MCQVKIWLCAILHVGVYYVRKAREFLKSYSRGIILPEQYFVMADFYFCCWRLPLGVIITINDMNEYLSPFYGVYE